MLILIKILNLTLWFPLFRSNKKVVIGTEGFRQVMKAHPTVIAELFTA